MSTLEQPCAECGVAFQTASLVFGSRVLATQRYCNACIDRREQQQVLERERRETTRLAEAWDRICPPLFRDTDLSRLPCPLSAREPVLGWQFGPRGLLIGGPPRTGKTRLVYQLLSRLHHVEHRRIVALTATRFSHQVSVLFGEGGGKGETFIDELTEVPVLFMDDIGKGRLTDRVEAEFFHVIDTRINHLRPTLLTTNLNGEAFASIWSVDRAEPLLGRFQEFFQTVTVLGADAHPEATT